MTNQKHTKMQQWFDALVRDKHHEENVAREVHSFVGDMGSEHKLLACIREKMRAFARRPFVGSIAVMDQVMSKMLNGQDISLRTWQ